MIKLYLSYFFFGLYIVYITLLYWGFSAGPANIWPFITLFSAVLLFSVASVLSLFYSKSAAAIGLIGLIGVSKFSVYLLGEMSTSSILISSIILIMFLVYLISVFFSITTLINYNRIPKVSRLKRPIKLILTFIPIALLLFLTINIARVFLN